MTSNHVHRTRRPMGAPADIVLNTAADLDRARAWLPPPLRLDQPGPEGTVDVAWSPDEARRYEIRVAADDLRLEWRPTEAGGWPGVLLVTDEGAGASVAELQVESGDQVSADEVREFLDQALRGLATEVEQNFTPG